MRAIVKTKNLKQLPVKRQTIQTRAEKMLHALSKSDTTLKNAELSILLCDDVLIKELNQLYRKKNKPTDVLAFALREGEDATFCSDLLGDVIISMDTARHQAKKHNRTLISEVTLLLAHGLLHLLGYDHQTDEEEKQMNEKTEELIRISNAK